MKEKRGKNLVNYCRGKSLVYNPRYAEALLEHMAKGGSFKSFGGIVGISLTALDNWVKDYDEFNKAKEIGSLAALGKWEEIALLQANGVVKGNASTLIFMLKNQFGEDYKDKQEVEHTGDLQFLVNTGIDRSPSSEAIEDNHSIIEGEFKEIKKDSDLL